jgi:TonB family protein
MSVSPASFLGAALFALAATLAFASPADAQRPGDPVPANHPSRAFVAQPVYTSTGMVFGTWSTVALDGSPQALTGAPRSYDIVVGDREVTISSPHDPYGPRSFGIVNARLVDSWVEYELRGQGGTYYLTAQVGSRADGKRAALFVLSPPGPQARSERFAVPEADGSLALGSVPTAAPVESATGARARRVEATTDAQLGPRRVSAAELMSHADRRVAPTYPAAARAASVTGTVVVEVVVDTKGRVVEAVAVAGHAALRAEAVRAAGQWRFKPFEVGGAPATVRGQISFKFDR